jgi:hypothetical protein
MVEREKREREREREEGYKVDKNRCLSNIDSNFKSFKVFSSHCSIIFFSCTQLLWVGATFVMLRYLTRHNHYSAIFSFVFLTSIFSLMHKIRVKIITHFNHTFEHSIGLKVDSRKTAYALWVLSGSIFKDHFCITKCESYWSESHFLAYILPSIIPPQGHSKSE